MDECSCLSLRGVCEVYSPDISMTARSRRSGYRGCGPWGWGAQGRKGRRRSQQVAGDRAITESPMGPGLTPQMSINHVFNFDETSCCMHIRQPNRSACLFFWDRVTYQVTGRESRVLRVLGLKLNLSIIKTQLSLH